MKWIFLLLFTAIIPILCQAQINYTFTGKGLWSLPANWSNNSVPPSNLPAGSTIYIYPAFGDTCRLNVNQSISPGASLQAQNSTFIISNGFTLNNEGSMNLHTIPGDSVLICTQKWMLRNLDVTTYRNGNAIPMVSDPLQWGTLTTGAWCYYGNDPANGTSYGKLYNWYAVNDPRGLAPAGWRIPTWEEWASLSACLGGDAVSAGPLKEVGTAHWTYPNVGATNTSGFTAVAGGWRSTDGIYKNKGSEAYWWSSNSTSPPHPWGRAITNSTAQVGGGSNAANHGFSVRCIKN